MNDYHLKPISIPEKNRLIELQFYMFVTYLLETYNQSTIIYDILDTLANLFGCNITITRALVQGINVGSSSIIPEKEELGVLMYKSGASVRTIRRRTKIHPQTLYRAITKYITDGQPEFLPRLEDASFMQIKNFMEQLDRVTRWK